jgi:surface polysaccharide O-acyltransferase-like enzyme
MRQEVAKLYPRQDGTLSKHGHRFRQAPAANTPNALGSHPAAAERRLLWADLIRVYAIAAVVLLHCQAVPNTRFGEIPMSWWWQTNIYNAFVCTCIPLFVMLSGALLLTQEQSDLGSFFRKRAIKMLIPLPAWTLVYFAWCKYVWRQDIGIGDFFGQFVWGMTKPVFPHLWFMYLIISLYLLVPILRVYFAHASRSSQLYFAALWLVASAVNPVLERHFGVQIGYYLTPFYGYVGYLLLGATMLRYLPDRVGSCWLAVCWAVVLVGYAANLAGTYYLSLAAGKLDDYFYQHLAPTTIAMSLASFVLLRHYGTRLTECAGDRPLLARYLATLSALSFGVYLVHALVIVLLESGRLGFTLHPTMLDPILAAPIMAAVVFVLSAVATALLRHTSALRWLVP